MTFKGLTPWLSVLTVRSFIFSAIFAVSKHGMLSHYCWISGHSDDEEDTSTAKLRASSGLKSTNAALLNKTRAPDQRPLRYSVYFLHAFFTFRMVLLY